MDERFIALLYHIKDEYQPEIFADMQKTRALLKDLAPEMKKENNLLMSLLSSNGYAELKNADDSAFCRVLDNLENIYSIKKNHAVWIINAFSSVMNGYVFIAEESSKAEEEAALSHTEAVSMGGSGFAEEALPDTAAIGGKHTVAISAEGRVLAAGSNTLGQLNVTDFKDIISVTAGQNHTAVLTSDGRVLSCGDNSFGQCMTEAWEGVKKIASAPNLTIGLLEGGGLVFAGKDAAALQASDKWKDIIHISASDKIIAGVKSTGKMVISDNNINISHWRDIISVSVSNSHIAGLCADGRVVAAGRNNFGQCDVRGWSGVVQIATGETNAMLIESSKFNMDAMVEEICRIFSDDGQIIRQTERISMMQDKIIREYESFANASVSTLKEMNSEYTRLLTLLKLRDMSVAVRFKETCESLIIFAQNPEKYEFASGCHTVGLKSDGTVVAAGWNSYGQCEVSKFFNVKKIIAGGLHTIGLRYDGLAHFAGSNIYNQRHIESWREVGDIYISRGGDSIIGVSNGRLLNAGNNDCGQCDVDYWEVKK